jgi:hypothetical protein
LATFDNTDGGLISGEPCQTPCFYGIQLGDSREQVLRALNENGIRAFCREGSSEYNDVFYWYRCGRSKASIAFDYDINVVQSIVFSVNGNNIKVKDAIDEFGNPDYVVVEEESASGTITLYMSICYESINTCIITANALPLITESQPMGYMLGESTLVDRVVIIADEIKPAMSSYQPTRQPWDGYLEYFLALSDLY